MNNKSFKNLTICYTRVLILIPTNIKYFNIIKEFYNEWLITRFDGLVYIHNCY